MTYIIAFILFLIYTIGIFFIKEYYILGVIALINVILMIILKENIKNAFITMIKIMPFIIFTSIINTLISGVNHGLLIGIRLILVCNTTYIFANKQQILTTSHKLQYVIETILKPLKIIKVNSREIGIMVCIAIAFIPIVQNAIIELKYSLKSKGFNVTIKNIIKKPNYILAPLITSVIKRIDDIENSLISKGYA